ncbi:MAG TPA: CDP-diacylglycerol--serine O-phosphatidyltransferase [Ignavibacteriaceae bacterium]|nr:CDP-diacylglycerol--serine O-phosphatidyltransferase [Ignavibacteriaceae bacterium]
MNRLRITPSVIPNLFTSLNMFCGFFSIINASQGNYVYAGWLIFIAALFDALDGAMARLTNSSSELGVELDSLSDIISFGAAPSFLLFTTYYGELNTIGIILTSFPLIAGGFRLARFNVQLVGFEKSYFTGLPIPSAAITIASFVLAFYDRGYSESHAQIIIPMTIVLSLLMVSRIRYDSIPRFSLKAIKEKPFLYILIIAALIIIILYKAEGIFYSFVFMIVFGIFSHIFHQLKNNKNVKRV